MKCVQESCSNSPVITDGNTGEVCCTGCGSVLIEKIETMTPEHYNSEQYVGSGRSGGRVSLTMADMGLSTIIGVKNNDATGKSLSADMKNTFYRLRMWDARSRSHSIDRSLNSAFILLNSVKEKLSVPDTVIENTAHLYRKALAKKLTRGRNIAGVISASLYISCKEANIPRTLADVADASNISIKDLSRHVRVLVKNLDLKLESYDSSEFVTRIASVAQISEKTQRSALNILSNAKEKGFTEGKNPVAMAASSLYLSCMMNNEDKSQRKIAAASGISMVTIRNRSRFLVKALNLSNLFA